MSRGRQERHGRARQWWRAVMRMALLDFVVGCLVVIWDGRSAVVTAALDANAALAAHVDRAVDFTNRHSVQANADLVRDCLNEIRDDADRNLGTPVPWRECLPAAPPRVGVRRRQQYDDERLVASPLPKRL
jgi:hypothetical protein